VRLIVPLGEIGVTTPPPEASNGVIDNILKLKDFISEIREFRIDDSWNGILPG